jgi:hypothetical protein
MVGDPPTTGHIVLFVPVRRVELLPVVLRRVAKLRSRDVEAVDGDAVVRVDPVLQIWLRQAGVVPVQAQSGLAHGLRAPISERYEHAQLAYAAIPLESAGLCGDQLVRYAEGKEAIDSGQGIEPPQQSPEIKHSPETGSDANAVDLRDVGGDEPTSSAIHAWAANSTLLGVGNVNGWRDEQRGPGQDVNAVKPSRGPVCDHCILGYDKRECLRAHEHVVRRLGHGVHLMENAPDEPRAQECLERVATNTQPARLGHGEGFIEREWTTVAEESTTVVEPRAIHRTRMRDVRRACSRHPQAPARERIK